MGRAEEVPGQGATQVAPSPSSLAMEIGALMARRVFAERGNKHEVHLREVELSTFCAAAAEVAIIRLEGRRA